jgi:hypothetical protein
MISLIIRTPYNHVKNYHDTSVFTHIFLIYGDSAPFIASF